ncbi:MAG: hypothetical protein R3242_04945 [Akkermansiaceae bacterium]|nr:hypothetical protein [Akkermansiaceae bacterium]
MRHDYFHEIFGLEGFTVKVEVSANALRPSEVETSGDGGPEAPKGAEDYQAKTESNLGARKPRNGITVQKRSDHDPEAAGANQAAEKQFSHCHSPDDGVPLEEHALDHFLGLVIFVTLADEEGCDLFLWGSPR